MSSGSLLFSTAVISASLQKLIGSEKLNRMTEQTSLGDALKVLYESGFADGMTVNDVMDWEKIIDKAYACLYRDMTMLLPKGRELECLYLENDYQNAKTLFKAKLIHTNIDEFEVGNIDTGLLKTAMESDIYQFLPPQMREALENLVGLSLTQKLSPQHIDIVLDRAYVSDLFSRLKRGKLMDYFVTKIDLKNLCAVVRAKKLELPIFPFLMPNGSFNADFLMSLFELNAEGIAEKLRYTKYKSFGEKLASILQGATQFFEYEQAADIYLNDIYSGQLNAAGTMNAIIAYYLVRQREIKNVCIALTGITASADRSKIKERLYV